MESLEENIRKSDLNLPEVSVVIPAYNEVKSINRTVDEIKCVLTEANISHEIIIVDDGSTDGTCEAVTNNDARVISHDSNRGYGAALKTGIHNALADTIIITDSDATYPNDRIPDLLASMKGCDMVVGSRTGKAAKIPLIRRPAKWCLSKLANYLVERKIPDLNSGMRVMKKAIVNKFIEILPNGFSFTTTITLALMSNDYLIKYIPIDYHARVGSSKIRPFKDTLNFIMLIVRAILYFNPLKVIMPPALLLLILGGMKVIYDILTYNYHISTSSLLIVLSGFQILLVALLADLIVMRSKLGIQK